MPPKNVIKEIRKAQEQEIEHLSFGGGGAKAGVNSGAMQALDEAGILKNIKSVAGSSAGAITAAFLAAGLSPEELYKLSTQTNLKELLGDGFLINKDGKPLYKLLQDNILRGVSTFLRENEDNIGEICANRLFQLATEKESLEAQEQIYLAKIAAIEAQKVVAQDAEGMSPEESRSKLEKLAAEERDANEEIEATKYKNLQISKDTKHLQEILAGKSAAFNDLQIRCEEEGAIYFKDLELMHAIAPERFKKLIVTAVRRDNSDLTIFDAENTPDVEVALACRASGSIPLVFEPVKIKVKIDGKEQTKEFVDGGYRGNLPMKYFGSAQEEGASNKTGRSLALAFGSSEDKNSDLHVALFSAKKKITNYGRAVSFIVDVVFKMAARIGGTFKYIKSQEAAAQEIREKAHDLIPLDTKKVSTLSFDEAQAQGYYLHVQGQIQTQTHLENYEISRTQDSTLPLRSGLLKIIEKTGDQREDRAWLSKSAEPMNKKTMELLSFCESKKWEGKSNAEVLQEFIVQAALNRKTGARSSDTNTIKNLVAILNEKTTPTAFVKEFKALLGKTDDGAFKKEDFNKIIDKAPTITAPLSNKPASHTFVSKFKSFFGETKAPTKHLHTSTISKTDAPTKVR